MCFRGYRPYPARANPVKIRLSQSDPMCVRPHLPSADEFWGECDIPEVVPGCFLERPFFLWKGLQAPGSELLGNASQSLGQKNGPREDMRMTRFIVTGLRWPICQFLHHPEYVHGTSAFRALGCVLDIFENPYGPPPPTESQNPQATKKKIPKTLKTPIIPKSKRSFPKSKRTYARSKRSFPKSKR